MNRIDDIFISADGNISFKTTSEMYGITDASGSVDFALRTGSLYTGDGDSYTLRAKELQAIVDAEYPCRLDVEIESFTPVQNALVNCEVQELIVKLPNYDLGATYKDLKKALEKIGGKWNTKEQGFKFEQDPTPLIKRLVLGEDVNIKKQFQFFATSSSESDELVQDAGICEGDIVLEPSAGDGALVLAARRRGAAVIDAVELMELNRKKLEGLGVNLVGDDFLKFDKKNYYNKIIANPPFTKNQDIDHVLHMFDLVKKGGRVVSIMSCSWRDGKQKKQIAFQEFLKENGARIVDIDAGAFKDSGTNIKTCRVIIDKK